MRASQTQPRAWSGAELLSAIRQAAAMLDQHRDAINALNVFPVPDGDTGTNMSLTMREATAAMQESDTTAPASEVAVRFARGALMGARGNSGVILSQFFHGFATGLDTAATIDGTDMIRALQAASAAAYKAVAKPVEGTMLTVIRNAAESAAGVSPSPRGLSDVLDAALAGAQDALAGTPDQLEILRQAGVVDAGGQGIVYILDAFARSARGEHMPVAVAPGSVPRATAPMAVLSINDDGTHQGGRGYCTNLMVFGQNIDPESIRTAIGAMGESAVVVGDDAMLKIHIHTSDPAGVLAYAAGVGELDQVRIDNMDRQIDALAASHREADHAATAGNAPADGRIHKSIAIVAVAPGDGIGEALQSLGADVTVPGGQSMNPSTEALLAAVESCSAGEIILLPNNRNIIMAARQVDALTDKSVRVVPTESIPAALSALSAFNTDDDLASNIEQMTSAFRDTIAISITSAVRTANVNGVAFEAGRPIGLVNGDLAATGDNDVDVMRQAFALAGNEDPELITVFVGGNVAVADQELMAAALANAWPGAAVEMHAGGQPHYRYIISVE